MSWAARVIHTEWLTGALLTTAPVARDPVARMDSPGFPPSGWAMNMPTLPAEMLSKSDAVRGTLRGIGATSVLPLKYGLATHLPA